MVKIPQFEQIDKIPWLIDQAINKFQSVAVSLTNSPKKMLAPFIISQAAQAKSKSVLMMRKVERTLSLTFEDSKWIPEAQVSRRATGWLSPKCLSESPKKRSEM